MLCVYCYVHKIAPSIYNTSPYDEQIRINQYERGDKKEDEATAY